MIIILVNVPIAWEFNPGLARRQAKDQMCQRDSKDSVFSTSLPFAPLECGFWEFRFKARLWHWQCTYLASSSIGRVVIDMNGFYSHFPHIGLLWKLAEETLSVGLSKLRWFTQKFLWKPANTIFDIWGAPHPALFVGAISCTHFTFLCGVAEKACIITALVGKSQNLLWKIPASPGTSWNCQLEQFAPRWRQNLVTF